MTDVERDCELRASHRLFGQKPIFDLSLAKMSSASIFIAFQSRHERHAIRWLLADKDFLSQFDTEDPAKLARLLSV